MSNARKNPIKNVYTLTSASSGVISPDGGSKEVQQAGSNKLRIAAGGPDFGGAVISIYEWMGAEVPADTTGDYWVLSLAINATAVAAGGIDFNIGHNQPYYLSVASATVSTDVKLNI